MLWRAASAAAAVLAVAIATAAPGAPAAAEERRGAGDRGALLAAARGSIAALEKRLGRERGAGSEAAEAGGERRALATLRALDAALAEGGGESEGDDGDRFARRLAARLRAAPAIPAFVTGYHEPLLAARRRRDDRFRFPIYAPPPGAVGAGPTRTEIEGGALAGRGLEIFWVDDPVELFFLHVQGSGRLRLEDGRIVRVGFAGTNGRAYRSIGKVLLERGAFARPEDATAPAIKAWLRDHPGEAVEVMRSNDRFVFFREAPDAPPSQASGPRGALGVPLVPFRSVAVDPAVTPLGSVGRLELSLPDGRPFAALVIAMDTGAAIRGPGRLDLFVGGDPAAAETAGLLRAEGTIAWLEPRRRD